MIYLSVINYSNEGYRAVLSCDAVQMVLDFKSVVQIL